MSENEPGSDLAQALAAALQALDEGGREALEAHLAAHPAHAPAVRERVQLLEASGMLGGGEATPAREVPEHLGEFELREKLGGGGMGVVYRAFQPSLGREVALKLIRPEHLYFPRARERFRREVEAVARLEHAGIVRVYAAGEEGGVPFFAMERIEGLSLDRLLALLRGREPRVLDERTVRAVMSEALGRAAPGESAARGRRWSELCCAWARDLAMAVDHAHRHGVLHRDLKPSNVMVTPDLAVVLLDFGLANTRESAAITRSGSQLGSVPYMAPEQLAGEASAIDERTDVYGLGVTLCELLTLKSPFWVEGESEERTRRRILDGVAPPIRALNPAVSWDLETVCSAAMERDPARRYGSAGELATDLHNVLELRPIAARRPGATRRLRRWAQRQPAWAVGIALGSLLVVVGPSAFAIREHIVRGQISAAKQDAEAELETQAAILGFLTDDLLAGVAPDEVGREASIREVLDVAAQRVEESFADRPHVEAALQHTIGHTYMLLGELAAAEPHVLRAVELFDRHRGPEHEHTLKARRTLASLYQRQDRLAEAESVGRQVVETLTATRGPEDLETLTAKNNLGLTLIRLARYDEAEALLTEVVEARLRLLGEEHEHTLASMANLGLVYYDSGRPKLAEPWWRRELEASKRVFAGKDHPDLLVSLNNWANVQDVLGRTDDALAAREELVRRAEAVYGPNHPTTILYLTNLGGGQLNHGDYAPAERSLTEALARGASLPAGHTLVQDIQLALARLRSRTGRTAEALTGVDEVLQILRADADPKYHRLVNAECLRANILMEARSWAEAEAESGRAEDDCARGELSGTILANVLLLRGQCLERLDRYAEAADVVLRVDAILQECAPSHRMAGIARRALARIYEKDRQPEAAERWRKAASEWQEATSAGRD